MRTLGLVSLLWLASASVLAAPLSARPPTVAEVIDNTRPLIRARLRLPDSLRDVTVTSIAPSADDPQRYAVALRFKARTPFGAITEHQAYFSFKRSSGRGLWIITSEKPPAGPKR